MPKHKSIEADIYLQNIDSLQSLEVSEEGGLAAADVALNRHRERARAPAQHHITAIAGGGWSQLQGGHLREPADQRHQPPDHFCGEMWYPIITFFIGCHSVKFNQKQSAAFTERQRKI